MSGRDTQKLAEAILHGLSFVAESIFGVGEAVVLALSDEPPLAREARSHLAIARTKIVGKYRGGAKRIRET